jgi:hypothetical protein
MCGIALNGLNEVRDQVCAALELNLNLRECLIDCDVQSYEAVVLSNCKDNEKYYCANENKFHTYFNPLSLVGIPPDRDYLGVI